MPCFRIIHFLFVIDPAQEREPSQLIFPCLQDLLAQGQRIVQRAVADISLCRDDKLPRMPDLTLRRLEDIDLGVVLVSMQLIQDQRPDLLAVLGAGIGCVELQL